MVSSWLEEDCPSFDYGGFVVGESQGEARLLGKSKVLWGPSRGCGYLIFRHVVFLSLSGSVLLFPRSELSMNCIILCCDCQNFA